MERERKRDTVRIALVIVTILLTIAVAVLAVYLGLSLKESGEYKTGVENVYEQSFYSLMTNYVDIETGLNKVKAAESPYLQEQLLKNVAANAELATVSLSTMTTKNNNLHSLFRFSNQVADYGKYLVKKLESGERLSEDERSVLDKMHGISNRISAALGEVSHLVSYDTYRFVEMIGKENDAFTAALNELENGSIEYPSLIYDGPFSDSLETRTVHGLTGEDITQERGAEMIEEKLKNVKSVTFAAENTNRFKTFLYDVTYNDGTSATVQLTEKGGHLVMFDKYVEEGESKYGEDEMIAAAAVFLKNAGYADMKSVWSSVSNGSCYINFVYEQDGAIVYPDMIKVKVSASTGSVVGAECLSYLYNHRSREIGAATLSKEEALAKIGVDIEVGNVRLALIPKGNADEVLTYEIIGDIGGDEFYLYVNASTGEEEKILMRIKSADGDLLI